MKTFLPQKTFRFLVALCLAFLTAQFTYGQKLNPPQKGTPQKGHALYKQSKIYDSQTGPTGVRPTPVGDRASDRVSYEQRLLQNPQTKEIPKGINTLEVLFSEKITERSHASETSKKSSEMSAKSKYSYWENRGPGNVGGRTRALAIDRRNENTIFAAGVSGGLWQSRDLGASWRKVTLPWQDPSITAIVQDPRQGRHNTWYYTAGERFGNSAFAPGAFYAGTGVFKSVNNGRSWFRLNGSNDGDLNTITAFDIIHNIAVDPKNGDVYVATFEGIYRSQQGGLNFELVLPGARDSKTDILITPEGKIYATVDFFSGEDSGFFVSDNGDEWTNITPVGISPFFGRTVMAFDPSDEERVYFFSYDLLEAPQAFLWRYQADAATPEEQWADLSANLPNDVGGRAGNLNLQGDYNMMIKVHPTNPDLIFLGGTNLYRSTTGFTTPAGFESWIGGYTNLEDSFALYPNHHPDQHNLVFLPSDPNRAISSNDGGVQLTEDISVTDSFVAWQSLNNGYITTQPYAISYDPEGNSDDLLAGFQDNGTWFTNSDNVNDPWTEEFGGDGSYNAIADGGRTRYVSSQFGRVFRINYDESGAFESFTSVQPAGGTNFDFVAPFILDPVNDNIMYMPAGDRMWRNNDLDGIPLFGFAPTDVNWVEQKKTITPDGSLITALDISKFPVANVLYYGTSSGTVYRVENANLDDQEVFDISTGRGLPEGNINNVYVDPKNPDRVFVTFSNYGIPSIFMTRNAGDSWVDISGNLEENRDGSGNGPSVRWFGMNGRNDGYFAATSTGLYFTFQLRGRNTKWFREPIRIGNGVAVQVKTRADGFVAAAIHGNGVYSANFFVRPRPEPTLSVAYLLPDKTVPVNFEPFEVDITDLFVSTKRRPNIDIQITNSNPGVVNAIIDGNTLKVFPFAPDVQGSAAIGLIAFSGREQVSEGFTVNVIEPALYDQSGSVTFSAPSQNFLDLGLVVQAADDFTVPAGATWTVEKLIANGEGGNAPSITDATVVIYEDNGGLPGAEVYNSGSITPTSEPDVYDLNLELPEALELGEGSYWLSVYTNLALSEEQFQWAWSTQSTVVGNEAVLRDDGVFFEGITDWTPQSIVYDFTPEDQVFQIFGTAQELSSPEETVATSIADDKLGSQELAEVDTKAVSAVWPNPSTNEFFFSLPDSVDKKVTARVYNILGQMVYEKADVDATRTFSWDAAEAPSGLYLVKISGARTNNSFSIVKQ